MPAELCGGEGAAVCATNSDDFDKFGPDLVIEIWRCGAGREAHRNPIYNVAQLRHNLFEPLFGRPVIHLDENQGHARRRRTIDLHHVRFLAQRVDHRFGDQRLDSGGTGAREENLNFGEPRCDGWIFLACHATHTGVAHNDDGQNHQR